MKFLVTTVQELEVLSADSHTPESREAVLDSLMNTLLDMQDAQLLTSDEKFDYIPGAIRELRVEAL